MKYQQVKYNFTIWCIVSEGQHTEQGSDREHREGGGVENGGGEREREMKRDREREQSEREHRERGIERANIS